MAEEIMTLVANSGLVLNPKWPHLGVLRGSIVCCICCGRGALNITSYYT